MPKQDSPSTLSGILPVLATPFRQMPDSGTDSPDPEAPVSERDMLRIVDFVLAAGVQGVVFPGVASEFNFLTVDERRRLTELVSERVAARVPLIVGASAQNTDDATELAETGVQFGACAAMIMAPAGLGAEPEPIIDFFQQIARNTRIDIILQNAPPPVGAGLSVQTICRVVAEVPQIRYVKEETLPSGQRISRLLKSPPDHLRGVMGGGGARYVVDELNRGACGAMPACELSDIHVKLFRAHQAGDLPQARQLYNRSLPLLLFQAVFRMRMTKEVLRQRGIIQHAGLRAPLPEFDDHDHVELKTLVDDVTDLFTVSEIQ